MSLLHLLSGGLLAGLLAVAAAGDLRTRTIPNTLTGGGAAAITALRLGLAPGSLPGAVAWALGAAVPLGALALAAPAGMGMGDAKLAGVLGLALGPGVAIALLTGFLAASGAGALVAARHGVAVARRTTLPLGPFLAAGGGLAWCARWP